MLGKVGVVLHDAFAVVAQGTHVPVTGLVQANFTIRLYNPLGAEVSSSITVTITERGLGSYDTAFTPNMVGVWLLVITNATYIPWGVRATYQVFTQLFDDITLENLGPGDKIVRVTVEDEDTGAKIPAVLVTVLDSTGVTTIAFGYTNNSGLITFMLYNGTYKVYLSKIGAYNFDNPETLVVSGATSITYTGEAVAPAPPVPPAPSVCKVYGWTLTQNGQPVSVSVVGEVIGERLFLRNHPEIIRRASTTSSRTSDGYWELTLTRSAQYTNEHVKYAFIINNVNIGAVEIPDQATVGLHELVPNIPCIGS